MRYIRKELGKLISYANALNVSVFFGTPNRHTSGDWTTDGTTITVYETQPLTQWMVLCHELAHHKQWLADGKKVPLKTDQAFYKYNNIEDDSKLDKASRKLVYEAEKRDSKHQLTIHYETQSKVPLSWLKAEIALDLFVYSCYYKTGKYPSQKEKKEKRKELRKKYAKTRLK
jgi:hypothetical protein